jgi:uncharacterized membrane protein YbhN (UPF0104 family)
VATAGRHLSRGCLITAGIAVALVAFVAAVALTVGAHPGIAERTVRRVAGWAPRVRPGIDPGKAGRTAGRLAVLAVLGYRIVNFWLPLLPGAVAYLRIRLNPGIHRTQDRNERNT